MPSRMPLVASLMVLAALIAVPAAGAAARSMPVVIDEAAWSVAVDATKRGDCRASRVRGRWAATRAYRTPVAGVMEARLAGRRGSDWDLAVIDAASGRVLGASLGFGAREVVAVPIAGAERILLRVCRRSGAGRRARLSLTHATLPAVGRPERLSLVEVDVAGPADHERLVELGFDTADHSDGRTLKIVLHGADDGPALLRAGFPYRTLVADLGAQDRRDRLAERRATLRGIRSPLPSGRTEYRMLADYQADMKALAEKHPGAVRGFVLPGTSLEGREISGIEVAADVNRTDDGRPHFYIDGVNHAREWPAGEIPIEFAFDLVENPKADPRLTQILNGLRTVVVPIVNVDGFEVSRTAGEPGFFETVQFGDLPWAATGTGAAYKRKNCRFADEDPPPGTCLVTHFANDMGVDTNRNYGFGWGGPGASDLFVNLTYRGAAPFSEPETTALRKLMFGLQPVIVISTHTVAALMLRPPGQQETPDTPDEAPMKALGDAMGEETGYRSERSWELYDTTGTTIDWTYGALATWSYTPELDGDGFHADHPVSVVEQYEGNGQRGGMRAALILAGEAALKPDSHAIIAGRAPAGRTLRVTRSFTTTTWDGDPLEPDVHTSSITVPDSGSFEWHVTPSRRPYEQAGTWTVTCERDGTVVETRELAIERGQRVTVDLPCGGELPATAGPACIPALESVRVRRAGRGIKVTFRRLVDGRVSVALLRGRKRLQRVRGRGTSATLRRVRNGRYVVRVTLLAADGRRDVRIVAVTKRGARLKVGRVREGC